MKNLIKNVIRSFKNNKLSIVGLVLLLFFGLGVFCVMSNTTANITNEYTSLAQEGHLHDFTVSEMYDAGKADYRADNTKAIKCVKTGDDYSYEKIDDISQLVPKVGVLEFFYSSTLPDHDGTFYIPLPEQKKIDETGDYIRTYYITLDEDLSKGLYSDYAKEHAGTGFVKFKYTIRTAAEDVTENITTLQYALDNWSSYTDLESLCVDSVYATDYHAFNNFISSKTSSIYSLMTTGNTPLSNYLTKEFNNEVEKRYFKSINITATKDNVFYKIINSNPEDNIDKVVLFKDPNGRTGNHLYSVSDWAPFNSKIEFYGVDDKLVPAGTEVHTTSETSFMVPGDFNELAELPLYTIEDMNKWDGEDARLARTIYSQIIQIRFKRMLVGDYSSEDSPKATVKIIAATNLSRKDFNTQLFTGGSEIATNYNTYIADWYKGNTETIDISPNGNVVLSWTNLLGVPSTLVMSNWSSKLALVNPQHLEKTSKRVITPDTLNKFKPYQQWFLQTYKKEPVGEINTNAAKDWFNILSLDQFNWWINPNTKKESWNSMEYPLPDGTSITMNRGEAQGQWNGINPQSIASCGGYDEIIWGCGLTPDFMYPIVDISRPTPNTTTECLVFTNESGYFSIKLAFVTSPVEDYLVARFKPGVNTIRQQFILDKINDWATGGQNDHHMIFPEGTKVAFRADDTSNILNCSGFRIAFIPRLVNVIQIVSTVLCAFIGILCAIICFVIIKRYVENNRINIGIMRANGIKKWKIALSLFPFALFPAVIGGVAAYVTGLFLQAPMLTLFSNYWMLPTPLFGFDILSFLVCIFAPFLIFTLICFISTFIVLRTSAVQLMKAGSEFKTNSFSRIAKKPFKYFGVLTRFRVSLAFNSITRLIILAAMSCLTMSSLVFAMTTFDKLNQSKTINSTQFDYDFNIELTTPSSSGGTYNVYDYSTPLEEGSKQIQGFGWTRPEEYAFNVYWNTSNPEYATKPWHTVEGETSYSNLTKPYISNGFISGDESYMDTIGNSGLLMLPSAADATGQKTDLLYLQNKHSARTTLNYEIGVPGIASSNPWEIALSLMPANSRNLAADSFNNLTDAAGHKMAAGHKAFIEAAKKRELVISDEKTGRIDVDIFDPDQTAKVNEAAKEAGIWFKLGYDSTILDRHWYSTFPQFFKYDEASDTYNLITDIGTVGTLIPTKFNTDFISLLVNIYHDPELLKMEYPMSYGSIPLNWDLQPDDKKDETYTYVNGFIKNLSSNVGYDPNHQLKIEGIKKDTNYIHLTDNAGHSLNERLWSENYLTSLHIDNEETYPIIINAFAAHKYKLGIGDTITINITNDVDRFVKYDPDKHQVKFKVVGVSVGTNNEAFYTTQEDANNIVGLPNGNSWNRTHKYMMWSRDIEDIWEPVAGDTLPSLVDLAGIDNKAEDKGKIAIYHFNNGSEFKVDKQVDETKPMLTAIKIPVGFNGIYTHNKSGKPITSGLSLYSYTGMYPGAAVYKSQGSENKFRDILSFGPNLAIANIMSGINNEKYFQACENHLKNPTVDISATIDEFIDELTKIYGSTTMITAICGAVDVAASDLIYNNLISTFDLAETTVMSIIIPITIIIVAVISNLIINDSRRMAAMLKALGYSDIKNLMSILALFVPTIIIGLALAIPLSFGLVYGYQAIIFNTANILVDITQKWWYYVAAIGGIGVILVGTYGLGYISLKRSRLVDEIK